MRRGGRVLVETPPSWARDLARALRGPDAFFLGRAVGRGAPRIGKIVKHGHVVARVHQLDGGVAANVARCVWRAQEREPNRIACQGGRAGRFTTYRLL